MRFKKLQDWAHQVKSVLLCCHHPPISQLGSHFSSSRFSLHIPSQLKTLLENQIQKWTHVKFFKMIHETSQQHCHPKTHWSSKKCRKKRPKHSSHIFSAQIMHENEFEHKWLLHTKMEKFTLLTTPTISECAVLHTHTHTRVLCRAAHICVCLVLWNVIKV